MTANKKRIKKLRDKKCQFCPEDNYHLLDVHRIVPGSSGGSYHEMNTVTCCVRCHRMCHCGEIRIDKKYSSTAGILLHYWRGGDEFWERA